MERDVKVILHQIRITPKEAYPPAAGYPPPQYATPPPQAGYPPPQHQQNKQSWFHGRMVSSSLMDYYFVLLSILIIHINQYSIKHTTNLIYLL